MAWTLTHEWLCQRVVEDSQIAIIFADRDGIIHFWNSGAEGIFGYSAKETVGQTLDLIVPERQRSRHWEGYNKVMATGVTKYGRECELLGAAAIMQDVTARWEQQKELRKRLAALEAKLEQVGKSA